MISDEIKLIKEVQQGNYDSFTTIYETYFSKIYTFLLIKSNGNKYDAEEVTATTFMKAFENIKKFSVDKEGSSFVARLYKIAHNSFLDMKRNNKSNNAKVEDAADISQDYTRYFQKHIQAEQILSYLEEMGGNKKDLFVLRIWNNLTYEEIAEILGKRSSTCRKEFSKLVKKIADHFKYRIDE